MRGSGASSTSYRPVVAPWATAAVSQGQHVNTSASSSQHGAAPRLASGSRGALSGVTAPADAVTQRSKGGEDSASAEPAQQQLLDAVGFSAALRDVTSGAASPGHAGDVVARVELLHALRRCAAALSSPADARAAVLADGDVVTRCFLVLTHAWTAADAADAAALSGGADRQQQQQQQQQLSASALATWLEAAYGAFAALTRCPCWPGSPANLPAEWAAALFRRLGTPRARPSEVPHLRDVLYWAYRAHPPWRPPLRRHLGALLAAAGSHDACWPPPPGLAAALDVTASVLAGLPHPADEAASGHSAAVGSGGGRSGSSSLFVHHLALLTDQLLPLYRIPGMLPGEHPPVCALAHVAEPLTRAVCALVARAPHAASACVDAILGAWPPPSHAAAAKGVLLLDATERVIAAAAARQQATSRAHAAAALRAALACVCSCLSDQHAGVAARAGALCASAAVSDVAVAEGNEEVLSALVTSLVGDATPHWSADVNCARRAALMTLRKAHPEACLAAGDAACAAAVQAAAAASAASPHNGGGNAGGAASPNMMHLLERLRPVGAVDASQVSGAMEALSMGPAPALLPDTVGANDLITERLLGSGSFGTVHAARVRCRDVPASQWRQVAVKRIHGAATHQSSIGARSTHPSSRAATAAAREVAALRAVAHPGVARLVTAFTARGDVYLVLELATGGDLHSRLHALGRPLPALNAAFLAGELVAALGAVHDAGLAFGDVKPENVVFTSAGHAKLTDFGGARPLHGSSTGAAAAGPAAAAAMLAHLRRGDWRSLAGLPAREPDDATRAHAQHNGNGNGNGSGDDDDDGDDDDRLEGTTAYLAPELLLGAPPSEASDAWALGCVLALCLTCALPVWSPDPEVLLQRIAAWTGDTSDLFAQAQAQSQAGPPPGEAATFVTRLLDPSPRTRLGGAAGGGMRACATSAWLTTSLPCACELLSGAVPPPWPAPASDGGASAPGMRGAASVVLPRQNSVLYSRRHGGAGGISLGRGAGDAGLMHGPIPQTGVEATTPWAPRGAAASAASASASGAKPPAGGRMKGADRQAGLGGIAE